MSEVDRLIALGSVDAILDELHEYRTEWDDARDALDALIGATPDEAKQLRAEVERLRSQLAMHLTAWRNASRRARVWRERVNRIAFANVRAERVAEMANRTLGEIEGRIAAAFAAADERGVSLDAMTVAELTRLVMGAVHGEDETDAPTESCDECDLIGRNCVAHGGRPTVAEPSTYSDPAVRAAIRRVNDSA